MVPFSFSDPEKEVLLSWAKELETTDLPQEKGHLRRWGGYCCLGILCNQYDPHGWNTIPDGYTKTPFHSFSFDGEDFTMGLPPGIKKAIGFDQVVGQKGKNSWLEDVFAAMNDELGYSFLDIAKEIRALVSTGSLTQKTLESLKEISPWVFQSFSKLY